MRRRTRVLVVIYFSAVLTCSLQGQAIVPLVTKKTIPQATIDVIDPVSGTSTGSGATSSRLAVGDVILFRSSLTPVGTNAHRGLQGYMTEYIPANTEVVGVRIIDANGNTVRPNYPGIALDGCYGGTSCNTFTALSCSTGTCSFPSGSIAQVHADTGVFYSNDARLERNPGNAFLTTNNGITMSPAPSAIDPEIVTLLGDSTGPFYAHNAWDWAQVRAYGTSTAAANTGGDGNTPHLYGSPVAGLDTHYPYEATEVSGSTIQFNNVVGPWSRVFYPGSTIGFGTGNIGSSSNITRVVVESTGGSDITPGNPVSARAVRIAIGEIRIGEPRWVELALRVTGLPLDSGLAANAACVEAFGSTISSKAVNTGGRHNPWPTYIGSPACTDLRLAFDLSVDRNVANSSDQLEYSLQGKNLALTAETNVAVRMKYDPTRQSFIAASPSPTSVATCSDDASRQCLLWNLGTLQPSDEYAVTATFDLAGFGQSVHVMQATYRSDQYPAPGYSTQAVTVVGSVAMPALMLATSLNPTTAFATAGGTAAMTGAVSNTGTDFWTQSSITLVLPTGWSIDGSVTLGGTTLTCSAACGSARPVYSASLSYTPAQSRTLAFTVRVPAGTADGLYRIDVQTWGSAGVGGEFETYFPRAAFVPVGAVRTQKPTVTCPIRNGSTSVQGSAEANASVAVRFNMIDRGTATADGAGLWTSTNYTTFGSIYGGLEVTAVATASGKLESEPSLPCFVTNFACTNAPIASNSGPSCEGGTIELTTPAVAGATYSWTGPDGFASSERAPVIAGATPANGGTYSVTVTFDGCTSPAGTTDVVINPRGATPGEFTTASASVDAGDMGVPYAVELVPDITYHWNYSGTDVIINGSGHSVTLDFYPEATSGTLSVVAENECGLSDPRSLAIAVTPPPLTAPEEISAFSTGGTEVWIVWIPVPSATYEIFRSNGDGSTLAPLATTSDTLFIDASVIPNKTYLYAVRARRGDEASPLTAIDPATTVIFDDDPLAFGNVCRASHIVQLRTAVDAMRRVAGLDPGPYSEGAVAGSLIRGTHILELRSALDEARSLLNLAPIVYTDPTITAGSTTMKAAHIEQLRNGVK